MLQSLHTNVTIPIGNIANQQRANQQRANQSRANNHVTTVKRTEFLTL